MPQTNEKYYDMNKQQLDILKEEVESISDKSLPIAMKDIQDIESLNIFITNNLNEEQVNHLQLFIAESDIGFDPINYTKTEISSDFLKLNEDSTVN